jgi:SAM-dependent methyltransferase
MERTDCDKNDNNSLKDDENQNEKQIISKSSQISSTLKLNKIGLGGINDNKIIDSNNNNSNHSIEVLRVVDQKQNYFIDVRIMENFYKYHIENSCNLPWNDGSLEDRMFELPPRKSYLTLISDDLQILSSANELLNGASYFVSEFIYLHERTSVDSKQSNFSTLIFSNHLELMKYMEENKELENNHNESNKRFKFITNSNESARFWKANPFLEKYIGEVEKTMLSSLNKKDNNDIRKHKLKAIDIGCGSGRDVVKLALRGWLVSGVDNDINLLEKLNALSKRNNCSESVLTYVIDMETKSKHQIINNNNNKSEGKEEEKVKGWEECKLVGENFHLVHVARYLYREMFDLLKDLILPGGFVICKFVLFVLFLKAI